MIRPITECEQSIAKSLLEVVGMDVGMFDSQSAVLVRVLDDGGMGSLEFFSEKEDRVFGKAVSQCSFIDDDGIEVLVTMNLDQYGKPYELDIWKTDHSSVIRLDNAFHSKFEKI